MRKLRRNLQVNRAGKHCDQAYLAKSGVHSSSYLVPAADSGRRPFCAEQSRIDFLKLAGMAITAAVSRFIADAQLVAGGSPRSLDVSANVADRPRPSAPLAYAIGKSPTESAGIDESSG